jgi:hypothetical protein
MSIVSFALGVATATAAAVVYANNRANARSGGRKRPHPDGVASGQGSTGQGSGLSSTTGMGSTPGTDRWAGVGSGARDVSGVRTDDLLSPATAGAGDDDRDDLNAGRTSGSMGRSGSN